MLGNLRVFGDSGGMRIDMGVHPCFFYQNSKFLSAKEKVTQLKQV